MRSFASRCESWNRALHYYLGLYVLFFLWLFSLTGLMLNHQGWFRDLYARQEIFYDSPVEPPAGESAAARARDIVRQLDLRGEIDLAAAQPVHHLDFIVSRPNGSARVRVDLPARHAYVKEFANTPLHAFQVLHTFSGSRFTDRLSQRDWAVTTLWVVAMDVLALALIVMVLGSYYMWWRLERARAAGLAALAAGVLACVIFVAGVV